MQVPATHLAHPADGARLPRRHWAAALALSLVALNGMGQTSTFRVLKANEVIGHVIATRQAMPDGEVYSMVSHCELDVVWTRVIRSSLRTEYTRGELTACHTSLRVNDAVRDSSSMVRGTGDCYVHPEAPFDCERRTHWTTSRLYFEEPVGQELVFVESVLRECPLRKAGPGIYTLTFPNGHVNHYVYRDGMLQEIRVDRPLMDLVFRRS
jgi:hypothetical protein